MDRNILKAKWKQFRGRSKILRAKLTNNNRGRLSGKVDVIVGDVQEKFSHSRQKTTRNVNRYVSRYQNRLRGLRSGLRSRK
jgi:uncharacterized protein YjbJ (UPF0337 family)